jgi:hypothetical protein
MLQSLVLPGRDPSVILGTPSWNRLSQSSIELWGSWSGFSWMLPYFRRLQVSTVGASHVMLDTIYSFKPQLLTLFDTVAGYFTWRTLLEGSGVDALAEKLRTKWMGALVASWRFWPAVNIFNFAFIPVHFRVLYVNCLSLFWSGYLSHVNARRLAPGAVV